jgi:hypothetical protein
MIKYSKLSILLLSALLAATASPAFAQTTSKVPVTTVVTVLGPSYSAPPALGKSDVVVYTGRTREDVTAWTPAQGEKASLQLAILIDDGTNLGPQVNDIRNFVKGQPKDTAVCVYYATNGFVKPSGYPFTTDHDAAANSVRISIGFSGTSTSMYLALIDLIKNWPATSARREILVIGDGIDRYRGDPDSPDVAQTIALAQRTGIIIHTLYARVAGGESRNLIRVNYGQSNLGQMADETGGEAFFQGLNTPIAFAPFLEQLDMVLHNQYFLTFTTERSTKKNGDYRRFRINTEQKNVEISAPPGVWVSGPAK